MNQQIDVYISDNCAECEKLIQFLEEANLSFYEKNTTKDKQNLMELQQQNVFITPAVIIDDHHPIIGFQPDKIIRLVNL
ncbi:thioredoxin family protein [Gracilibacillus alcaliphilus]|uniref:thioredoxin family protein n=1 Tax=Gracilibacillus alcaliphilus TaxID=1401441 RepID=UPI0019589F1F|nr:glutaredoxin [Gracilibacillus alcaliphilus]